MMKNHRLYNIFTKYLEYKKFKSSLSEGELKLLKISESYFNEFKTKYEEKEEFKSFIDKIIKSQFRDEKINQILDETDNFF
jgi:hypothetical protein